jgi:YD repeat-containing protein
LPPIDNGTEGSPTEAKAYWNQNAPRLLAVKKSAKVTGVEDPSYSEFKYDDENSKGNLTYEYDYDSTKSASLPASLNSTNSVISHNALSYATNGNLISRLDAKNTPTVYEYQAGSCMNSYPTKSTQSTGVDTLITTMTWYCESGLLHTSTDPINTTTTYTYDALGRVLSMTEANGSNTFTATTLYSDSIRTVTTTTPLDSSRFLNTTETYDERGRLILAKTPNATCGQASVEHRYLTPNSTDTTNYGYSYELVSNPVGSKYSCGTSVILQQSSQALAASNRLTCRGSLVCHRE